MKKAARDTKDKWLCFRKKLPFEAMPADDLPNPWQDLVMMDNVEDHDPFPLMIFEIKAIKPIEEAKSKASGGFKKKTFKSPEKNVGVNLTGGGIAQAAFIMEALMKKTGMSLEQLHIATHQATAKKRGHGEEDEDVDGDSFMAALGEANKKNKNGPKPE
jgi:hypothetical protein